MSTLEGYRCVSCDSLFEPDILSRCPECGGILDAQYVESDETTMSPTYPIQPDWLGAGNTPLLQLRSVTDELNVDSCYLKDEGYNPTGSFVDRELALVVAAATQVEATGVHLVSTGNGGQAAAAYAARAGIDSEVYVPSRCPFSNKAMINVYGGNMRVINGRFAEAYEAYQSSASNESTWFPAGPFATPYRHEAVKGIFYEVLEQLESPPDALVLPAGHGTLPVGLWKAIQEHTNTTDSDANPAVHIVQPEGCAPIASALMENSPPSECPNPDTIVGDLEIPAPDGAALAVEAVRASGGRAVTVSDADLLDMALTVAQSEGMAVSIATATAIAGAWALNEQGAFTETESIVFLNTASAIKDADIIRSRLMSKGL